MVYCMHLYSLTVRVYNVLASRSHWVDPKISGKHRGGKKISTGRRSVIQRKKTKREKREGRREKGEVLAVVLSQYVATIAEQDERRRWSWAPPCLEAQAGGKTSELEGMERTFPQHLFHQYSLFTICICFYFAIFFQSLSNCCYYNSTLPADILYHIILLL